MDLTPAWFDAIAVRTSHRRYDSTAVAGDVVARLRAFCETQRPSDNARVTIIEGSTDRLFTGVLGKFAGSYGRVEGAPLAAAFVGREGHEGEIGYLGEGFILEATTMELGTCWIAGTFDKQRAGDLAELAAGERVMAVTPLGTPVERRGAGERLLRRMLRVPRRLPLETLALGIDDPIVRETATAPGDGARWPLWARTAVEAARLAPSGVNRQPWRFRLDGPSLVLTHTEKLYWTAPFDLGIARLHAELGAAHEGVRGTWEPLAEPDVARFVPA